MSAEIERNAGVEPQDEDLHRLRQAHQELQATAQELRRQNQELLQAHRALKAEQERYRYLFDFAPGGYLLTDTRGIIHEANRAASDLLGAEPGDLVGKTMATYVDQEMRPGLCDHLERLAAEGEATACWDLRLHRREGDAVHMACKVVMDSHYPGDQAMLRWLLRDVTQRYRAHAEHEELLAQVAQDREVVEQLARGLVAERDVLQTIMENTGTCLAYLDREFRFQRINLACARAWGCENDLLACSAFRLKPDEDNETIFRRVRDSGQPLAERGVRLARPSPPEAEASYWDWSLVAVKDAGGQVQGLVLSMQDVTDALRAAQERERLLDENRDQRQFLERLLQAAPVAVGVVSGPDHRFELANADYYPIPGRPGVQLVGRTIAELFPSLAQDAARALEKVYSTGRPLHIHEYRAIVEPSREPSYWNASYVPLPEPGGTVERVLIVVQDITAEVIARQEIEVLAAQFQQQAAEMDAVFEAMVEGVLVYDNADRLVKANRTARTASGGSLQGKPRIEIVRQLRLRYLDGREVTQEDTPVGRALRGEVVQGQRYLFTNAAGEDRVMAVSAAPLMAGSGPVSAVAVWSDVTEQVRSEQAVRDSEEKLRVLVEELEAYDFTVAHDLKNPLSMVVGSADLLAGVLREGDEHGGQRLINSILTGARRLNEIVESLLLLASTRSAEIEIAPLDMGEVVVEARQDVAALFEQRGARLVMPPSWPVVLGYRPWLVSVWSNYLSNALKYGGSHIELGFSAPGSAPAAGLPADFWTRVKARRQTIAFWVHDDGLGLTEEQYAALFVPFSRLGRPEKLGHGLGLAVVRRIVHKLGGEVGVESRLGHGCTFWFTLPRL